jgi:hypothetical protein
MKPNVSGEYISWNYLNGTYMSKLLKYFRSLFKIAIFIEHRSKNFNNVKLYKTKFI